MATQTKPATRPRLPVPGAQGPVAGHRPIERLAERARAESWTHEEFLAACLEREVAARQANGGRDPHPGGPVPGPKDPRGVRLRPPAEPQTRRHRPPRGPRLRRGQGERRLPGPAGHRQDPPGHRAVASGPARPGTGCSSPPRPNGWTASAEAHDAGRLHDELTRLGRYPLIVIDEVGYIPFDAEAANLFFQLVSSRYERASVIVTSNKPFGRWGEVFGDAVVAAAMIDRLVHHAEVVSMKGDSYRLKDRDLGRVPTDDAA